MESSNQISVYQEQERQISIYYQNDQVAFYDEDSLKNETRTIPQLQVEVLNQFHQILQQYNQNSDSVNIQKVMKSLKQTKSSKDVLHNLLVMLPTKNEISDQCDFKAIFDSLEENGIELKKISNSLEKLTIEVQSIMKTYKSKLESFKGQIQAQNETNQSLTNFIKSYCDSYFKEDIKKIKKYQEQIEQIDKQITQIQNNDDILRIHQICRNNVNQELMGLFVINETQIIKAYNNEIKNQEKTYQDIQNEICCINQKIQSSIYNIQYENQEIQNLKESIKNKERQQQQIEKSLEQDQDNQLNIEELFSRKQADLDLQKNMKITQLKNYQDELQINLKKEYQNLLKMQQNSFKIGKSYNLILLIDDSGSMHESQGVFSFLKKTPYELLKESIVKLVEVRKSQRCKDKISIIKFSNKSYIIHRGEQIENIKLNLDVNPQKLGTNFNCGFKDALECIKESSEGTSSILIFQTDGFAQQNDQCKSYIEQMKAHDRNMQMFTLAIGDQVEEEFLKSLTKLANNNIETFNKTNKYTMNYYQKLINAEGLSNVFSNISLGISEQMEQIQQEFQQQQIRYDSLQQDYNQKVEKFQYEIQQQYDKLEKDKQEQLQIRDKREKQKYLSQQIKEIQICINELKQKIKEKQQNVADHQKQQEQNEQYLNAKQNQLKETQEEFQLKKNQWKEKIFNEQQQNEQYRSKMQDSFNKIGCSSEVKLRVWAQTAVLFDQFIYLLSNYTSRFKNFYQKFQDICENLMQQTSNISEVQNLQIIEDQQIKSLTSYFGDYANQADKNTHLINAEQLINKIFKLYIYLQENDQEKQATINKCAQIILQNFENLENMLREISFNKPKVKKQYVQEEEEDGEEEEERKKNDSNDEEEDNDGEKESKILQKLLKILKDIHKSSNESLIEEIENLISPLIRAKLIKKSEIPKIKNKNKLDKLVEKFEDFFDDFEGSSDQSEGSNSEEDEEEGEEERNDNQKARKKNMKKKAKSKTQKVFKTLQNEEDQQKMIKQFKEKAKKLISIFKSQKQEVEQMKKCWKIIDFQISKVLSSSIQRLKSNQINQLCNYLDQEMIQPLGALLDFQEKSN